MEYYNRLHPRRITPSRWVGGGHPCQLVNPCYQTGACYWSTFISAILCQEIFLCKKTSSFVRIFSFVRKSSFVGTNLPFIVPCAGRVLKVLYRSNADNSSATATWRLRTVANNETVTLGHAGIVGTTTCTGPDTDEVATANFIGVDSNEFNAEDIVFISIQNDVDVGGEINYFVTVVLELYYDTLGY